jgi:formate/nitrite transporter FocA (FNT family)
MKRYYVDILLRAVMTGFTVGLGATTYLSCENQYLGAFLFGTGLFVILSFGFSLFTGRVGYAVENNITYVRDLVFIWLGNFAGAVIMAYMILNTRISGISERARTICAAKLGDNLISVFILAFFCGILMFIAADGYKTIKNPVGQILAVFLPVMVFILSGFEHCIANMFYFTLAEVWSMKTFGYLIVMTLGNAVGGMFIPFVRKGFLDAEIKKI